MTNESTDTTLKERLAPGMPQINFASNTYPNNQSLKSEVAITFCFQLCSTCYTMLQMKNSTRSVAAVNPVATEVWMISVTQPQESHTILSQINTLCSEKNRDTKVNP